MATEDTCCTIVPYFQAHSGKLDEFKRLCERFLSRTLTEPKCLYYGWSFDGDQIHAARATSMRKAHCSIWTMSAHCWWKH